MSLLRFLLPARPRPQAIHIFGGRSRSLRERRRRTINKEAAASLATSGRPYRRSDSDDRGS